MAEHVPPPEWIEGARPTATTVRIGPPPDAEEGTVGTAVVQRDVQDGIPVHHAFFQLTDEECAVLVAGGYVELTLLGTRIQPFAIAVRPADAPEPAYPPLRPV